MVHFEKLEIDNTEAIDAMSKMAAEIVREHFDPLIGKEQNDYMISLFQTPEAISSQLQKGYQYWFVCLDDAKIGFLAYYEKPHAMYLSKFYLYRKYRGRGYAQKMLDFVIQKAEEAGFDAIELNVNRDNDAVKIYKAMGFEVIREEKNDIGSGFYMGDYVMSKRIREEI